ncbi:hypothetical protein [Pseudomonas sp. CM27]|uniref:hypothetical protein n=1 Tax=Pseudomonas sp. CM27 TaxID=2738452 RepID=UPI00155502C1|nr:hypothetical protein [Pseudomonas sp. CM27]NQD76259.1 hypothetical protein [Pseudomonas sp. CM27]HEN8800484.1 hypothetical protein [Pseudomonas putida]
MMFVAQNKERWVLRLWGGLDALYVLLYVAGSIRRGHLPVVTDLQRMLGFLAEQGLLTMVLMVMNVFLQVSIIFSAVFFLGSRKVGVYVGLAQIPWRLLFAVPSLSVLLIWAGLVPEYNRWLMFCAIVLSELIKGGTLLWLLRRQRRRHVVARS